MTAVIAAGAVPALGGDDKDDPAAAAPASSSVTPSASPSVPRVDAALSYQVVSSVVFANGQ